MLVFWSMAYTQRELKGGDTFFLLFFLSVGRTVGVMSRVGAAILTYEKRAIY